MKKAIILFIFAGMLIGSAPLDAAVGKMRAIKCAIPRLHAKFNCTAEEKTAGKKWLVGTSVIAALTALAALVVGGVKLAEVRAEKEKAADQPVSGSKLAEVRAEEEKAADQPVSSSKLAEGAQVARRRAQVASIEVRALEAELALSKKELPSEDMMKVLVDVLVYLPTKYNDLLDAIIKNRVDVFGVISLLNKVIDNPELSELGPILKKIIRDLGKIRANQILSKNRTAAAAA